MLSSSFSVRSRMKSQWRKMVVLTTLFRPHYFNSSKCKTWAKMTTARIKLLRNKRESSLAQMRRDIAFLLQSRQDATARIRVEHVIREQNMMAANEILALFCDRIVARLSIISKRKECPPDLKEAIASLIFAGPRCSDIPELLSIRDIFLKKYGKDFVSAATDLRPNSGVNRLLIEKLSALNPSGEVKLKVMKEIAKEYQVEWDTTETEMELLKPPEERIEGPSGFVSASNLLVANRMSGGGGDFKDAASAAKAAEDSAKNAIVAAQAAAQLAQKEKGSFNNNNNSYNDVRDANFGQSKSAWSWTENHDDGKLGVRGNPQNVKTSSNYSYQNASAQNNTDIKFDDSDFDTDDEETESASETYSPTAAVNSDSVTVHPKLPDYDALTARFEALKYRKA